MLTNEQAIQLHHRSVLNQPLTEQEQAELEAWYARQDEEEARQIKLPEEDEELAEIRRNLQVALGQLLAETQRLRQIEETNEGLRNEVAMLRRRTQQQRLPEAA